MIAGVIRGQNTVVSLMYWVGYRQDMCSEWRCYTYMVLEEDPWDHWSGTDVSRTDSTTGEKVGDRGKIEESQSQW